MVTYGFSTVMKKGSNAKQRFGNILGSDCKDKIKKIFQDCYETENYKIFYRQNTIFTQKPFLPVYA